jgi:hypothetical protein
VGLEKWLGIRMKVLGCGSRSWGEGWELGGWDWSNRRGSSRVGKACSWAHTLWKTENRMTTIQKNTKHWKKENTSWKQNKRHQTSTKNKKCKKKQKKNKEGKKKTYIHIQKKNTEFFFYIIITKIRYF